MAATDPAPAGRRSHRRRVADLCLTAEDYRVVGYHVGRCMACGELAPVYGGRLVTHPTRRAGVRADAA